MSARDAMVRGGSRGGFVAAARAASRLRWTDPKSPWMTHRVAVEIENEGVGNAWSRQTQKHRRAA